MTNFEIQKYYKNETIFNGVYFGINLTKKKKKKDGAYLMNLEEYESIGTHWIEHILTAFELNIFQKKLKNLQETKIS